MTSCNSLFVDDSTNVKTLSHCCIVEVLNHSNGLAHTHALGCETSKDVGLGIACYSYECLSVFYSFLYEEGNITTVTVYDKYTVGIKKEFVKKLTTCRILLDNLHIHVVGQGRGCSYGSLATAHDHHVLHVCISFLTYELTDERNIVTLGHEICEVVSL